MTASNPPAVVHRHVDQATRRLALGGVALALLMSLASLLVSLRQPEPPVFVSVSMKSWVEDHMLATIGQDITQSEAELRTREFSAALNQAVRELTDGAPVMVLAAEAVVGENVPDFTEDIRQRTRVVAAGLAAQRGEALPPLGDTSGVDTLIGEMQAANDAVAAELRAVTTPHEGQNP